MGAGAPVSAFDVVFNREVVAGHARLWTSPDAAAAAMVADEADVESAVERGRKGRAHAEMAYRWDDVAVEYEAMARSLTARR
jgi:hypothetical protein